MKLLGYCCLVLALVAVTTGQRGGFFQALANLFSGGGNNNNNNRGTSGSSGSRYPLWLDTSDGRFAKFNGPVRGIPRDHGGGRFGKKKNWLNEKLNLNHL